MIREMLRFVDWLLSAFTEYKLLFERSISFSDDAAHVLAGVFIQVALAFAFRWSLAQRRPVAVVAVLETINEILDIGHDVWPSAGMQLGESLKDVVLTLALPMTFYLLCRYRARILDPISSDEESEVK